MERAEMEVLPELVELAQDEAGPVRLAAFETIISLLEAFDSEDRTCVIFPLVKSFCEKCLSGDEAVLSSLSFQYGKLCHGLSEMFTDEQHLWFLEFYKKLCCLGLQRENGLFETPPYASEMESKNALVRRNCAYNFPVIVLFADPNHFLSELYRTFSSLCHDPEVSVRKTTAAGFHQVIKLLGPNVHYVHKELITLLQDESLEVLSALLNNLPETLELATSRGEGASAENKQVSVPELASALVGAEQKAAASLQWRVHRDLLRCFSCLPRVVSGDQIYFRFLQRTFSIITTNNVLPVQREAVWTLCVFLRYNRKQEQRQEIISKMVEELARGRSYWSRLRYLDLCDAAVELFSKNYFCKNFLTPALELANDPVANVRYKLCYLLPKLRSTIRASDKHQLQQLEFSVRKLLCREKDKDVVGTLRKTVLELDKVDITEPYHKRHERELLDQKKETEETLLLEMEVLERQQSESKLSGDKQGEKKQRESKTSSKSTTGASSTGKETRRAKLARSRSLSSHPTTSKMPGAEKPLKLKDSGTCAGKNSVLPITDDSLRGHHFTVPSSVSPGPSSSSSSSSSMPVLIRSNTSGSVDPRSKDTQSRKLSVQRKSNSFGVQSGRD